MANGAQLLGIPRAVCPPVVAALVVALAQGCGGAPTASEPATPPRGGATLVRPPFPGCRPLRKGARVDADIAGEDLIHAISLVACLTGRRFAIDDAAAHAQISLSVKAGTADDLLAALLAGLEALGKNASEVEGVLIVRDNAREIGTSSARENAE